MHCRCCNRNAFSRSRCPPPCNLCGPSRIADLGMPTPSVQRPRGQRLTFFRVGEPLVALVLQCLAVARRITQRELRNESGKIMRALDRGERFVVTRNGVPVGELQPIRKQFVASELLVAAFKGAPRVDPRRFRKDVDRYVNQDIKPRA